MQKAIIKITLFILFIIFCIIPTSSVESATISRPPSNLGLVGYWPMDEGVGTIAGDSSGNGNNGTITGATWTSGKRGKALNFDGISNKIIVPNSSSLNISGSVITISVWFKASALSGKKILLNKGSYGYHWNYGIGFNDSNLMFRHNNGDIISTNISVSLNTWHNFTGIYSGGNNYYYFDGILVDTIADYGWVEQTGDKQLTIGAAYTLNSDIYSEFFSGQIDDVRIYNRALSATEISAMYKLGQATRKQVSNQGLVGYWSFNEGFGTKAGDSSGLGNVGTITGATWVDGKRGGALSFDGSVSVIDVQDNSTLELNGGFTFAAWVKPNSGPWHGPIVAKNGSSGYLFRLQNYSTGNFYATLSTGGVWEVVSTGSIIIPNVWTHVLVTGTFGGTGKIYVNGIASGGPSAIGSPVYGNENFSIGINGQYKFDGLIDEVRVYNRALSETEIQNLYKQTEVKINSSQNNKLTNGLVGIWSFDGKDVSGTTAYDRSGNGNNGTITGATKVIGKMGQGLDFKYALNTYVNLGNSDALNPANITISAWVKPRVTTGYYNYIYSNARDCCGTYNGYEFYISNTGLVFTIWNGTASYLQLNAGISSNSGWRHLVATYDGAKQKMYINGVLEKSGDYASGVGSPASYNSYIGAMGHGPGTYSMDGVIDEVRVYNRALSAEEVKQLYLMGK